MATMNCLLALAMAGLVLVSLPVPILSHCDDVDPRRRRELAADECKPSGSVALQPNRNPKCQGCCRRNQTYPTYNRSPPTNQSLVTKAVMTLHNFNPAEQEQGTVDTDTCYSGSERFGHDSLVVALSTGWYSDPNRCRRTISICTNDAHVFARVVGVCNSQDGCDRGTNYLPPRRPNIIAASPAVWKWLGITGNEAGEYNVTWADAIVRIKHVACASGF